MTSSNDIYTVHCFASVRVAFRGISAATYEEAIQQAVERFDWETDRERADFADEFIEFLVDVESDEALEHSRWFFHGSEQVATGTSDSS